MKPHFLLPAAVLLIHTAQAEMRMWTNTSGQIIEAEMIGVNAAERKVQVRLKSGATAQLVIDQLSTPDKEYARQQWAKIQSGAVPAPAAASAGSIDIQKLPPRYASRFSADTRLAKLLESGGTAEVEAAIIRSLDGLKSNQNEDGSWGRANKCGITGFVLQCFLAHGESVDSAAYGDTVTRGLLYLTDKGGKNPHGLLTEVWDANKGNAGAYEHPIAADALGQALLITQASGKTLPGLREAFEKAIQVIIEEQSERGSWGYGGKITFYNKETGNDLSVANWHFLALQTAVENGLKIDRLDSAIKKATSYIKDKQTKAGGFGGSDREAHYNQWSLSGGAAAGLMLLSNSTDAAASKGLKFLSSYLTAEPPEWEKSCNIYSWHGYANALHQAGGAEWQNFVKKVFPQIIAAQEPSGSFKAGRPSNPAAYAADSTYRQALCTLILETPYRMAK